MQQFQKEHERSKKKRNILEPSFMRVKAEHKIPRQAAQYLSIFKKVLIAC